MSKICKCRKFSVPLSPNCWDLRKLTCILLLLGLVLTPLAMAEVVTLRTGQTIEGEILMQNEEVVIIRMKNGLRYQYPAIEVVSISTEKAYATPDQTPLTSPLRKVNLRFQASGGVIIVPELGIGGQATADFMVGTHSIRDKRMFVGSGLGYRAKIVNDQTYSFIPLQAVLSMPLSNNKSAPVLGVTMGYGFAVDSHTQGGLCAGIDFGWNCHFTPQSSMQITAYAEWQQARTDIVQIVLGNEYTNHVGCNFVATGLRFAVLF